MKKILLVIVLLLPGFTFSQKVFEGKITYWTPPEISSEDSFVMISYFSPGKIRMEFGFNNNSRQELYSVIGILDSNIYYMVYPVNKMVIRIIVDSLDYYKVVANECLNGEADILGYKCFGIKESLEESIDFIDSNFTFSAESTSWYAKELFFPYKIDRSFSQSLMVYNDRICLLSETILKDSTAGEEITKLKAIKVENTNSPDSLFQIPGDHLIQTIKMSELLKDATIATITLTELKQEEEKKPEPPPPPPPPKEPKPLKPPAKKGKQPKPVKG